MLHSINNYRDNIGSKLSKLHRLVFMVCLRMSTHKESQVYLLLFIAIIRLLISNHV